MALLLLLRFGIVLQLIGLYLVINGPFLSVYGGAHIVVPGPFLKIVEPPPPNAVISQLYPPVQLPCKASIKNAAVKKSNLSDDEIYTWYKDGEKIPRGVKNEYRILENGTLRLPVNERASGTYRCLVNGTEVGVGAVLSTECVVKYAVLKRTSVESNITVEAGLPLVLDCPIISIPDANITWTFGNKTNINKLDANRFYILQNGSLLISSITENDRGRYKCVAKNVYAPKDRRQNVWSVIVNAPLSNSTGKLLPSLQNQTLFVIAGRSIKLHCASDTNNIYWTFTHHLSGKTFKISNSSNEIFIRYAVPDKHDGVYKCSTKNDSQEFNLTVVRPPVIEQQLISLESSLAASITFICNVSGTPQPNITWYRNGIPLKNTYTVYHIRSMLRINSFDINDEGIYQCFAENIGGEATTYGSLRLRRKMDLASIPKRPENIKCFPVNYRKMYITFNSSPTLPYMISVNIVTENPLKWNSTLPKSIEANSSISLTDDLPPLKPFVLFMRSLVITSTQSLNGIKGQTFDVSLLSDATKCATQGLSVNAVFFPNGVFLWWTQIHGIIAKSFIIHFWHNATSPSMLFDSTVIGSTLPLNVFTPRNDIESNLTKIPIESKVYYEDEVHSRSNVEISELAAFEHNTVNFEKAIIEVKVPGNVTGILIPNANKIIVRVLIITEENEDLEIDCRYVEWKTIENVTHHKFLFRADEIESRKITLAWNPIKSISCLNVCLHPLNINSIIRHGDERSCQDMVHVGNVFSIEKLQPETSYQIEFLDCVKTEKFGTIEVQTKPDNPGPITNYKIISNDGLKLVWDPPINPNGEIYYYTIFWDFKNASFQANVTESERSFKFPNVTENDKFNITIKAFGSSGIGLPQYIDLRTIDNNYFEKENPSSNSTFNGIAFGLILSVLCGFAFLVIFLWQRMKFKAARHAGRPPSPQGVNIQNQTPCSVEMHEIQTLIPKQENICRKQNTSILPNGNGIYYSRRDEGSSEQRPHQTHQQSSLDRIEVISPIGFCSSTPKFSRMKSEKCVPHSPTDKSSKISSSSIFLPLTSDNAQDLNLSRNSSSPNFLHNLKVQTNGNTTQHQNGSLKNKLPPSTTHSIVALATDNSVEPLFCKKQLNTEIIDSSQHLTGINNPVSDLDCSNQKLLDSTIDSNTSKKFDDSNDHTHYDDDENERSNLTTTTLVDINDCANIQPTTIIPTITNPIKKFTWSHRRPIIDPNG